MNVNQLHVKMAEPVTIYTMILTAHVPRSGQIKHAMSVSDPPPPHPPPPPLPLPPPPPPPPVRIFMMILTAHVLRSGLIKHAMAVSIVPWLLLTCISYAGSCLYPHMWLADGDSLMCYIVIMPRQTA